MDLTSIQLMQGAAGAVGGSTYVDDVYSTYVYKGNNGAQTGLGPGVDLTKGGLAWVKRRSAAEANYFFDSNRVIGGVYQSIYSESGSAQDPRAWNIAFNNNGLAFNDNDAGINATGSTYVNMQFRKAKGFFDIVSYTGSGSTQQIAHNLACVPGSYMIKNISNGGGWMVYHRSLNGGVNAAHYRLELSGQTPQSDDNVFGDTAPTATHFTAGGGHQETNASGHSYVCYLFAGGASTAATARSVDFAGGSTNDYLRAPTTLLPAGNNSDKFCLETWVRFDVISANHVIYGQYVSGDPGRVWLSCYQTGDNRGRIEVWQNGANTNLYTESNLIDQGQWYHVAWTYDGTNHRLFVNGMLKSTLAGSSFNAMSTGNPYIGQITAGGYGLNGQLSNFRVVRGQAVYTSNFTPSNVPLTTTSQGVTGTNCKVLCCNDSSILNNSGSLGALTNPGSGAVTARTDSPYDDLESFKFGEEEDKNIIKTGSYIGNGNSNGPEIHLGWEPQWIIIKNATTSSNWKMFDVMRGMAIGSDDRDLQPNSTDAESFGEFLNLTPTGWITTTTSGNTNTANERYVYWAIRRPDGYVGKPAEAGTDVFAMDVGNGSSTIPTFDSGFPVDFALNRMFASAQGWYTNARLTKQSTLFTDSNSSSSNYSSLGHFDSNLGWAATGDNTSFQSWMWKRHAGFDVVTYDGNGVAGHQIRHSLSKTPEMIWVKCRSNSGSWVVGHKSLDGGNAPWTHYLRLEDLDGEEDNVFFNDTAPTSTSFQTDGGGWLNGSGKTYISMLFASVDGISKVGSYTGNGNAMNSSPLTITTGFTPRLLIIKRVDANGWNWNVFDSVRGIGSGNDPRLKLNSTDAQDTGYDWVEATSTGFKVSGGLGGVGANGGKYIYYAHA